MATSVAACSSKRELTGPAINNPASPIDASGVLAQSGDPAVASVPESVVMVGDSITAGSQVALDSVLTAMAFKTVTINAERSRRIQVGKRKPTNGLDVVKFVEGSDPPEMWVIALGTNDAGLYSTDEEYQGLIDSVLEVIGPEVPLVWVNTYREDHLDGCVQFNGLLRTTLEDRGNATVADWYTQCIRSASDILSGDGVHPNDNGTLVFADTVRGAIVNRLA